MTTRMDLRWQLGLGCHGAEKAPFFQGVLVGFRERLIAHEVDRQLIDRTVTLARARGGFGWQVLRAALDSSSLLGAGRVEDTWNLVGRAVATCAAATLRMSREAMLRDAGVTLLSAPSLRGALDLDWTDPAVPAAAVARLLADVDCLPKSREEDEITELPPEYPKKALPVAARRRAQQRPNELRLGGSTVGPSGVRDVWMRQQLEALPETGATELVDKALLTPAA